MMEPLDPATFNLFNHYFLHREAGIGGFILRFASHLRQDWLTQAHELGMKRSPVNRSCVWVDLDSKYRYFWKEIANPKPLPLEFETITCSAENLEMELNQIIDFQVHRPINLEEDYPWRVICTYWGDSFTQILLLASHIVGDKTSACLAAEALFDYYKAISEGKTVEVESLAYPPSDWERLFNIRVTPAERERAQSKILAEYRLQKSRPSKEINWERLIAVMDSAKAGLERAAATIPSTKSVLKPIPQIKPQIEAKSLSIKTTVHVFSEEQLGGLRNFAKRYGRSYSVYDVLQMAYARSQADLARNQIIDTIRFGLAVDVRGFSPNKDIYTFLGNYSTGSFFSIEYSPYDDIPTLLKKIMIGRQTALSKLDNKLFLKAPILKAITRQAVKGEDWKTYLSIQDRFSTMPTNPTRFNLYSNNLGVMDHYFASALPFNLIYVNMLTGLPGPFGVQFHIFKKQLYLTCTRRPELTDPEELNLAWSSLVRTIAGVASTFPSK